MSMLIVIGVLLFLILIHEGGHFLAALVMKIRVHEFGFGYPPRALKLGKKWGTIFSLNWLPFGGFVRLAGDDAETVEGKSVDVDEDGKQIPQNQLFHEKSIPQRLFVVLAGVTVNLLFGVLAFVTLYMALGIPEQLPHPVVAEVVQGSPAETAQLKEGDQFLRVNGEEVKTSQDFILRIQQFRGKTAKIEVLRDGEERTVEPYVRTLEETPAGQGSLGVALNDIKIARYPWWIMIPKGVERGVKDSIMFSRQILGAFGGLITTVAKDHKVPGELSGPIGVVYTAEKENIFQQGPFAILNFAGLLSINLGVLNLLPIPALDGGRAVFIVLEKILGKTRRAKYEQAANSVGMLFLLGLIILISVKDVWMIVKR